MTQTETAAIRALEALVAHAIEEFRTTSAREVAVSNEIHRDIKDILERQDKRIAALETQVSRLIGGIGLAAFVLSVAGWQLWQAVVNH